MNQDASIANATDDNDPATTDALDPFADSNGRKGGAARMLAIVAVSVVVGIAGAYGMSVYQDHVEMQQLRKSISNRGFEAPAERQVAKPVVAESE